MSAENANPLEIIKKKFPGTETIGDEVVVKVTLSPFEKLWNIGAVRKCFIIAAIALVWQFYALRLNNALMFPPLSSTIKGLLNVIRNGELPRRAAASLRIILIAYPAGVLIAGLLTVLAITTRLGTDLLEILTAMFNPLPAIALLPLALLWFGLGFPSIVFVIVHAVVWPVALNIYAGFMGVSGTLRMVGRNYDLTGFGFVFKILIPAAFPHILTGLKVGWAFSWRTLIAAELVFGVNSGRGGLGWFIYENKNQLNTYLVFAGLVTVILIGMAVEGIVFKFIEERTVVKWGMKF